MGAALVGDGNADDTEALQSVVNRGGTVRLPRGHFRITRPLDLTERPDLILSGEGSGNEAGSVIVGDTGSVALDATGSPSLQLRNLRIEAGNERPSTVGILFARSKKHRFTEDETLENVHIHLKHLPAANGGRGSIGIYNNAAEIWRARALFLVADVPLVFTGFNLYGIKSSFTEHEGAIQSMSECTVDGASTLVSLGGPGLVLENSLAMEFHNLYINRWSGESPYAIEALRYNANLRFSGNVETFRQFLRLQGTLGNAELKSLVIQKGPLIALEPWNGTPPLIFGSDLNLWPTPWNPDAPEDLPLFSAEGSVGLRNTRLQLYGRQSLTLSATECFGIDIIATDAEPRIRLEGKRGSCSYSVRSPTGIDFHGPVRFHPN